jgi:hypothetical protein
LVTIVLCVSLCVVEPPSFYFALDELLEPRRQSLCNLNPKFVGAIKPENIEWPAQAFTASGVGLLAKHRFRNFAKDLRISVDSQR